MSLYENCAIKASDRPTSLSGLARPFSEGRVPWSQNSPPSFVFDLPCPFPKISPAETKIAEETALLKHVVQGNGAAFWQLWESHRSNLYLICLLQLGGNRAEAEDALSRAMLKAWSKLPAHATQIKNLRAWLSRLTYNLCVDIHRERRSACEYECLDDVLATRRDLASHTASPEEASIFSEVLVCLHRAVGRLPLRLREPFMLRFFHGVAYPEIAEHLALSPGNVRKRIQQARVILRQQLRHQLAVAPGGCPRASKWDG